MFNINKFKGYHACASGRGKTIIKNEFEKKNFANLTCR